MLFTVLLLAMTLSAEADAQVDPGKAAYVRAGCDFCHGPGGTGAMGPGLVPFTKSASELLTVVRQGIGLMPAHQQDSVSDADVEAIYTFLRRVNPSAGPAAPVVPALEDVTARLDRLAFTANDPKTLEQVRVDLTRLASEGSDPDRRLARYGLALAGWRQLLQAIPAGRAGPEAIATEAASLLREVIDTDQRFADAHALLAAVDAMQIARSWSSQLEAERRAAIDRAMALDPDNPRVSLLQGIAAFTTPESIGGGPAEAERHLRRAIRSFQMPRSGAWPNWGNAETWRWMGEVLAAKGDLTAARDAYRTALLLHPDFPLVRDVLLPRLETAAKRARMRR